MPTALPPVVSQKLRFFGFLAMVLLVFVHGYNLDVRYLHAASTVAEALTLTTFTQYLLANGLFRFRIPILFAISGYLFALGDGGAHGPRLRRRARTLLLPYLIWSAFGLALTFALEQWPATREAVVASQLQPFGDLRVGQYGAHELFVRLAIAPVPFQLWFVRCLFVYNLLYPLLRGAVTRAPKTTMGVGGLLWLSSFGAWLVEGEGLLFFTLGIWLAKARFDVGRRPSWRWLGPLAVLWVGVALAKTWLAFQGPGAEPALYLMHKFVVAAGMVVMWHAIDPLVAWAMARRSFAWVTSFSFMIYALHVPLQNYLLNLVFPHLAWIPGYRLLTFFLLPTLVVVICVAAGAALRRQAPMVYGWLTGGRGLGNAATGPTRQADAGAPWQPAGAGQPASAPIRPGS